MSKNFNWHNLCASLHIKNFIQRKNILNIANFNNKCIKMNSNFRFILSILILFTFSLSAFSQEKEALVLISTDLGNIKIKLYNETPKHRDNFLKLVDQGFYNGTIFHRVINEFMIQGGDPNSKTAEPGAALGNGGPGYTIPAEIEPQYFHKKGALAAARQGDNVNPKRESSGSQFYIVHGRKFAEVDLERMENRSDQGIKNGIFSKYIQQPENAQFKQQFMDAQRAGEQDKLNELISSIQPELDSLFDASDKFRYTPEQKEAYSTIGGSPHLDGQYTVFGEVVEGLDVIDKIAALSVDQRNRPQRDVKVTMEIVKK